MSRERLLIEAIDREHRRATVAILARRSSGGPHEADDLAVEDGAAVNVPDGRFDVAVVPHSWLE